MASEHTFLFQGHEVHYQEGDTYADALLRNGIKFFGRSYAFEQPQGLYCGIGRCGMCRATVDGTINRLLCISLAIDHAVVEGYAGGVRPRPSAPSDATVESQHIQTTVTIVGSGHWGRALAGQLRDRHVAYISVDERPWRVREADTLPARALGLWQSQQGRFQVWAADEGRSWTILSEFVVLATGAVSVPPSFDGGRPPGLMTFDGLGRLYETSHRLSGVGVAVTFEELTSYEQQLVDWAGGRVCLVADDAALSVRTESDGLSGIEIDGEFVAAQWAVMGGVRVPSLELWQAFKGNDAQMTADGPGWSADNHLFIVGRAWNPDAGDDVYQTGVDSVVGLIVRQSDDLRREG